MVAIEILEFTKDILEFGWMIFFSAIHLIGVSILIWIVMERSYDLKRVSDEDKYSPGRFIKVFIFFPFYAMRLLWHMLRNIKEQDNYMGLFVLLIFQNVDKLMVVYGASPHASGILTLISFIFVSFFVRMTLKSKPHIARQKREMEENERQDTVEG